MLSWKPMRWVAETARHEMATPADSSGDLWRDRLTRYLEYARETWSWHKELIIALVLVGTVLGIAFAASYIESKDKHRLLKQCMDDGKKEYECRSLKFH